MQTRQPCKLQQAMKHIYKIAALRETMPKEALTAVKPLDQSQDSWLKIPCCHYSDLVLSLRVGSWSYKPSLVLEAIVNY